MTVAELIAELSELPQNADVRIPLAHMELVGETTDILVSLGSGGYGSNRYDIVFLEP